MIWAFSFIGLQSVNQNLSECAKPNFIKLCKLKTKRKWKPLCPGCFLVAPTTAIQCQTNTTFCFLLKIFFPLLCRVWSSGFNPHHQTFLSPVKGVISSRILPSIFLPLLRMKRKKRKEGGRLRERGNGFTGFSVDHFPAEGTQV